VPDRHNVVDTQIYPSSAPIVEVDIYSDDAMLDPVPFHRRIWVAVPMVWVPGTQT